MGIFEGKVTAAFTDKKMADVPATECFSVVVDDHILNIRVLPVPVGGLSTSADIKKAWISGFREITALAN